MSNVVFRTLDCGLSVVVEQIDGVRSAGLTWLIPAGAASDDENVQGRAAVLSEMLMRGAGTLDSKAQADAFERLGVSRSCSAGIRFMKIGATMLGERASDTLALVSDMVRRPALAEASFAPSVDLAVQSLESLLDEPQERAIYAARERHYPVPFNRSGLGTRAGLRALTRDGCASFWDHAARPEGAILAVAGRVDPDQVFAAVDRLCAGWTGAAPVAAPGSEPARGYAHESDDSNQVQIIVVHDAPPESSADAVLERVVVSVLSGGMSGRLFTEVRERRGLCYAVSAAYRAERDWGGVTAYVGTTPERAQESLDVLYAELERINRSGVEPDEYQRAIVGMKSRVIFSGESTAARAAALVSDMHRLGRPRTLDEIAGEIDRVTLDRVNDYLSRRALGRVTVQTLGPGPLAVPPAGVASR